MIDWIADHAQIIGLIFFVLFFLVVFVWTYRPGKRDYYQNLANIPLKESEDDPSK